MIDEYVHFNDSARNSIMEKMTPDYMVVGIGSKTAMIEYMGKAGYSRREQSGW